MLFFRDIVGKIQEHEYKIQKMTRSLEDVLKYVDYQLEVLSIIRVAREVCVLNALI